MDVPQRLYAFPAGPTSTFAQRSVSRLDSYGHLWPDTDDSTRAAVEAVLADRANSLWITVTVD